MATKLRMARVAKDLTQDALSSLTLGKIGQPRISELERGLIPTREEAEVLAEVLGLPPEELWHEEDQGRERG